MSLLFVPDGTLAFRARIPGETRIPSPNDFTARFPGAPDVMGFSAVTEEAPIVAGLPAGVSVPADALALITAMRHLDSWIELGRAAQAWAAEQGHPDAAWVDDDDQLRLPPELAHLSPPAAVRAFLGGAALTEQVLAQITPPG